MTILSAALLLFLVMDPFGNVPVFLSVLRPVDPERRRRVIARELLIALVFLIGFLFGGRYVLNGIGISESTVTVAGGIILFLIALRMVFPSGGVFSEDAEETTGEPLLVPLAVPLIAGPSALASVLFIMSNDPTRWIEWLTALGLAWGATGAVLLLAPNLAKLLGRRGLVATERLMGMILTAIATKMVLSGVGDFFGIA